MMGICWTNLVKMVLFWPGHFSLDLVFWNGSAEDSMTVKASVKEAEGAQALGKAAGVGVTAPQAEVNLLHTFVSQSPLTKQT